MYVMIGWDSAFIAGTSEVTSTGIETVNVSDEL